MVGKMSDFLTFVSVSESFWDINDVREQTKCEGGNKRMLLDSDIIHTS